MKTATFYVIADSKGTAEEKCIRSVGKFNMLVCGCQAEAENEMSRKYINRAMFKIWPVTLTAEVVEVEADIYQEETP